jgi:hypothetical protein
VKERLCVLAGKNDEDVTLYEYLSPEKKQRIISEIKAKEIEKQKMNKKKNPFATEPTLTIDEENFVPPPLENEKKIWENGLENDAVVLFVYRIGDTTDWEPLSAEGLVPELT